MELINKKSQKIFARAPRLDTVLMVEEFIENNSGKYNQTQIFNKLPKKMMWNTFKLILTYLENSNKIIINKDGTITWIWNPELVNKYLKKNKLKINI